MSQPLPKPWTVEDFLAWERRQPERYEFVGGVIRMMVGGSSKAMCSPRCGLTCATSHAGPSVRDRRW
jgi:hypothetical protein